MATSKAKANMATVQTVFMYLSVIVAVLMFVIGGLALWANQYIGNMVRTELAAQKVYFPEKGAPNFSAEDYPDLQQYAGQLVDSPEKAKAYANGYIGRHLKEVAGGKVYAEVSAEAQKDPTNTTLAKQKATLFQGETLRGILLGTGFAFGTMGKIAGYASIAMFAGGAALLLAAVVLRTRI